MFSNPATSSGIAWADHLGKLILVEPESLETEIKTVHGDKDAVKGRVTILSDNAEAEVYDDALIFGGVLIGQLKSRLGEKVLGKLAQGEAKPGQNAPWKLLDATEADIARATAYVTDRDKATVTSAAAPF